MSPLANRLRPGTLDDVVGQEHILAPGKVLRKLIDNDKIINMIFYGPSGVGKTTVANIAAAAAGKKLYRLNGTNASTADIKEIVANLDTIEGMGGVVLYLDEIQYLNKKQQQTLLEFIEDGSITLIASTTENPYFYIYNAILSRCTVFEFKPVSPDEIKKAVIRAAGILSEEDNRSYRFTGEALEVISRNCGGDVRKALNAVELACFSAAEKDGAFVVDEDIIREVSQKSNMRYDRDGDEHYNILSAFQKSIRGSDENASLHYLARLIASGDLISIVRRLLVISSEDIGLAYPQAAMIVKALTDNALQIGFPEAQLPLSQAVILLATAPKSNSATVAIRAALGDLNSTELGDVPAHLKDGHYSGAEKLGNAIGYKYSHDYPNHYVKQQFLPDNIKDRIYYEYGSNKNEQAAKAYWDKIK